MPVVPAPVANPWEVEAHAQSAVRFANVVGVSNQAGVEFIHCARAQDPCVAQREKLRSADREGIESGNARAALAARIRIIQSVVVEEVVAGKLAPSRVGVHAAGELIVAHRLVKCGG